MYNIFEFCIQYALSFEVKVVFQCFVRYSAFANFEIRRRVVMYVVHAHLVGDCMATYRDVGSVFCVICTCSFQEISLET